MKAFLLFKDKDLDPKQILMQRERKPRAWETDEKLSLKQFLPWNEEALTKDLGLDILLSKMADGDNFLYETGKIIVLSSLTDAETILYRQGILNDCMTNEQLVRDLYRLLIDAIEKEKASHWWGLFSSPSSILHESLDKLKMFTEMLRKLRDYAEQNEEKFASEGFIKLFKTLRQELNDEYLSVIEEHFRQLEFEDGVLINAELGRGNKGTNYILNRPYEDKRNWFDRLMQKKLPGYTFEVSPRDEAGSRALYELRNQGLNLVANALAQSADHVLNFFHALRTELAFYIGCLNLRLHLAELNEQVCFPVPVKCGERMMSFTGLYDVNLALSAEKKVVSNNLHAIDKILFIITGANTGGKSTFLRSIGISQLMMQAGMFVPAESFKAEVHESIITHFKREEDTAMESGKFDEELSRMNEIVNNIKPGSIILLNESFAATNEREGSEIAKQITKALIESRIKVIFVTHQYEFAHGFFEKKMPDAIFLRAERLEDGTRSFRVLEGEPLQTSYGEDLYEKIFNQSLEKSSYQTQVQSSSKE